MSHTPMPVSALALVWLTTMAGAGVVATETPGGMEATHRAAATWEALRRLEAQSVRADPDAITAVLATCRELADRSCEARALLARAEALAQSGLPPEVVADAAAAESILRDRTPGPPLALALLLQRGAGGDDKAATARARYTEALGIARDAGATALVGRILCAQVRLDRQVKDFEAAAAGMAEIEAIVAGGNHPRVAACGVYLAGLGAYFQGDAAGALSIWQQFADSQAAAAAPRETLWSLVGLTALSINAGDNAAALAWARRAVAVGKDLHGPDDRGRAYCNLASALGAQGVIREMAAAADTCVEFSRAQNLQAGEEIGLRFQAVVAANEGRFDDAVDLYGRSLAMTRALQNPRDTLFNLEGMGRVRRQQGDLAGARAAFAEARAVADQLRWPAMQANTRGNLALLLVDENEIEKAAALLAEARNFTAPDGTPLDLPWVWRVSGLVHSYRQEHEAALADYTRAFTAMAGQPGNQAHLTIDLGNVYQSLFQPDRAMSYYERARDLAREAGEAEADLVARSNMALLHWQAGSADAALASLPGLIEEARRSGRWKLAINESLHLAGVHSKLEHAEEAAAAARQALAWAAAQSDARQLSRARAVRAGTLSRLGRHAEALALCDQADPPATLPDPQARMDALWICGNVHLQAGRPAAAVDMFRAAIQLGETSRARLADVSLRTSFFGDRASIYADLVAALLDAADAESSSDLLAEIFSISEAFRGRVLNESLAMARGAVAAGGQDGDGENRPVDLADAQAGIAPGSAVVEYLLGFNESFALVLTPAAAAIVPIALNREQAWQVVRRYRGLLEATGSDSDRDLAAIRTLGERLFTLLLSPALAKLPAGVDRLTVIPDSTLFKLPWEALVMPGDGGAPRYVIEQYEISTVPSVTILHRLDERQGRNRGDRALAAFADPAVIPGPAAIPDAAAAGDDQAPSPLLADLPPLPYSRKEVRRASSYLGGRRRIFAGADASESNAVQALGAGYAIVHFATHGFLDGSSSGRSGIVLAGAADSDGLLGAGELLDLHAETDLVILSGCATGAGMVVGGEGVLGLPHALFQAGVPSIVMSLWDVQDRSAALLMDRFYAGLAAGDPPGAALRQAKLSLLHSARPEWSHPALWAPFVLSGVADRPLALPARTMRDRLADIPTRSLAMAAALAAAAALLMAWAWRRRSRSG
ncbi:MAG: CHAT domain-containing protein [Rhodospirillales bacterium]